MKLASQLGLTARGSLQGCCWAEIMGQHSIFVSGLATLHFYIYSLRGYSQLLTYRVTANCGLNGGTEVTLPTGHSCLMLLIALACLQA